VRLKRPLGLLMMAMMLQLLMLMLLLLLASPNFLSGPA